MEIIKEQFEAMIQQLEDLKEECIHKVDSDNYILGMFDQIQDELVSLEVYVETM